MVQFHRGPAAVIGDERHRLPFVDRRELASNRGEGVASRTIRKPENLPVIVVCFVVPSEMGLPDQ